MCMDGTLLSRVKDVRRVWDGLGVVLVIFVGMVSGMG